MRLGIDIHFADHQVDTQIISQFDIDTGLCRQAPGVFQFNTNRVISAGCTQCDQSGFQLLINLSVKEIGIVYAQAQKRLNIAITDIKIILAEQCRW